jgi:hypothetical protein
MDELNKTEIEKKKKRRQRKKKYPVRALRVEFCSGGCRRWDCWMISHSTRLLVWDEKKKQEHKVIFIKNVFSLEEMKALEEKILGVGKRKNPRQSKVMGVHSLSTGERSDGIEEESASDESDGIEEESEESGSESDDAEEESAGESVSDSDSDYEEEEEDDDLFETTDPNRGNAQMFVGLWAHKNNHRPGNLVFPAKKGGKFEYYRDEPYFTPFLEVLGEKITLLVMQHRPDLFLPLDKYGWRGFFGMFHLFMCGRGAVKFHRDCNDYISVLFLIKFPKEAKGGGLQIKEAKRCFNWGVGDIVIMDTHLSHGTRHFQGEKKDRLVGIFLIQWKYLRTQFLPEHVYKKLPQPEGWKDIPSVIKA